MVTPKTQTEGQPMPTASPTNDWISHYVPANGIRHHYLEWGDPSNPPLLMLHATGLCAWPWKPLARRLAGHYRVLAFDQRGHGDTDASDKGYKFEYAGEDLAAVVEAMELKSPRVIGHSSGGLAAIIASNLLPGRFDRVVLVETRVSNDAPSAPSQDLARRAERTRMKRSVWESRGAMFEAYRTRAAFRDWEEEPYSEFVEGGTRLLPDGRAELKCHPETEANFYSMRDDLPVEQYLSGLSGDWLLLLANYPGSQRPEDPGIKRFRKLVPGSVVQPMGKGSHFLPMEYPDDVLKAIRPWLGD